MPPMIPRRASLTTLAFTISFAAPPAPGQAISEDFKITAADGGIFDSFGAAVAVSGTTAIVGALNDTDSGLGSGSAYLFDTTTGQQRFKLLADDGTPGDQFGIFVGISGTTAIVGAWNHDDTNFNTGSAYLFSTVTGQQLFKLNAPDAAPGDEFGYAVAISGATAIVGAIGDTDAGQASGSAYLFDIATGQLRFKLTADDADAGDQFGYAVAISGSIAIVGAHLDEDAGLFAGSAYIFDTTTGQQLFKLTASDANASDNFGISVGISATTAIVGANGADERGTDAGAAYIFSTTTGQQLFKLLADDAADGDALGFSVSVSGTTAVVGAYQDDDAGLGSGSAYLFDTTTGQQRLKLVASDAATNDRFGVSVSISDATVIVGADGNSDSGSFSGSAYIFNTAPPCPADLTGDGNLNFFDVSAFLTAFASMNPIADFTGDGLYNFFDVSAFLAAYIAGCP